ncbi:MAG: 6-phosphogluconolactonase [Vulcanimicrobiaceae bacterium]
MRSRSQLQVYPDAAAVAQALAGLFVDIGVAAIAERGRFAVSLAGGNTPRAAYELLALEPYRSALRWNDVVVFFGDERCVPPQDAASNYRMACEAFLDAIPIPTQNVHRIHGEAPPGEAATEYARELAETLGGQPRFDLVLLGMGQDGHTASLFPGTDPWKDSAKLVRAVYSPSVDMWRVTLTPSAFNAARCIAFAVEGAAKSRALEAVREGAYLPSTYPAQTIAPTEGRLMWLVDAAAAERLGTA